MSSAKTEGGIECRICGDRANAHSHYGAISCTSCRAFFRRAITTKADFQCIFGSNECEITKSTRKRCQACRLRTCLKVGMNPGWIMGERRRLSSEQRSQQHQPPARINVDCKIAPGLSAIVTNGKELNIEFSKTEEPSQTGGTSSSEELSPTGSDTPPTQPTTYSDAVEMYSKLVARAIKFAKGFQEFWNLSENDQRTLLLHNVDPIIQLCTNRGLIPPWCMDSMQYSHQHRDLQHEITMLRGDAKTKLLISFMALFSSRFCSTGLEDQEQVDKTREYSQGVLQKYLSELHGSASGTELFSKWRRILHCLQTQAEEAMEQQLQVAPNASML